MRNITIKIYPRKPAIYCIINLKTNCVYIGSTVNIYARLINHRSRLLANKHFNQYLQRSFNEYGIDNFKITILEFCEKDSKELMKKESYYCNEFRQETNLYNTKTIEKTNFGYTRITNEETRKKLSLKKKGICPSNLKDIQQLHRRKIKKITDEIIVEVFDSCTEAAKSLNMKPNTFNLYIGKKLGRKKSKYFPKNTRYEYDMAL